VGVKIIFLCKRRPQGKDLWNRPSGRFFHIPRILSERGHDVCLLLLSYKKEVRSRGIRHGMNWFAESIFPTGPLAYIRRAETTVKEFEPDWVVGLSDTYYGILAVRLAEKHGIPSVIDAYDNYESYTPWLKPLHHPWRKALGRATLVTAAGPHLAEYLSSFRRDKMAYTIPMASDPNFEPLDKAECRRKLDLSPGKKILGYCGAIHASRGVDAVFRAFEILKKDNPAIELVLTGRKQKGLSFPSGARWLGYLPDEDMPLVLNSLDILLVVNQISDFGRFSYPVKLYEAMRCHIPVVATNTPPVGWILEGRSSLMAKAGDDADLARKVESLLEVSRYDYGKQSTWEESSLVFERALLFHSTFRGGGDAAPPRSRTAS
jgi:glycosyltransferase involved in cell wall biosynthesis